MDIDWEEEEIVQPKQLEENKEEQNNDTNNKILPIKVISHIFSFLLYHDLVLMKEAFSRQNSIRCPPSTSTNDPKYRCVYEKLITKHMRMTRHLEFHLENHYDPEPESLFQSIQDHVNPRNLVSINCT